jgi:hypothetical protein
MATFTVTNIVQTQRLGSSGNLEDVAEVFYQSEDGNNAGSIVVPLDANWATAAEAALKARWDELNALLTL